MTIAWVGPNAMVTDGGTGVLCCVVTVLVEMVTSVEPDVARGALSGQSAIARHVGGAGGARSSR